MRILTSNHHPSSPLLPPPFPPQEYIDSLREDLEWLGWKPVATTFTSDYFDRLYELAIKLIKEGKAYVCHMTGEEIAK